MDYIWIILLFIGLTLYCRYLCKITVYYVYYNDDGVLIPGLLIRRPLWDMTFIPFERGCGFDMQKIYRRTRHLITPMEGKKNE